MKRDLESQISIKDALTLAVTGRHNTLFVGPCITELRYLTRRLPGLLPELDPQTETEVAQIYVEAGARRTQKHPFRAPHHTATAAGLVGGGAKPRPGEVTLAHGGVLYLEELENYARLSLQALARALGRREVQLMKATETIVYPASTLLIGQVDLYDQFRERQLKRLADLLPLFDIIVEVQPYTGDGHPPGVDPEVVTRARRLAESRATLLRLPARLNGELEGVDIDDASGLTDELCELLSTSDRPDVTQRVARTVADVAGWELVERKHVDQALGLTRSL